ncbi:MAG: hypothetical protein HKN32_00485 [Flavobacteriales bacterium]|nr:hypothetical protein [Flavobacteriales bacterium]
MKWILNIVLLGLLSLSGNLLAQTNLPITQRAARLAVGGELVEARAVIDEAVGTKEAENAYMWYVHGFIHKEIFKQIENESVASENREIAVESITRSKELDALGQYREDTHHALEYLATTYYNQAVSMVESLDPERLPQVEEYFDKYVEIFSIADPMHDFQPLRIQVLKSVAQAYEKVSENEGGEEKYMNMAIDYYKQALALDPEDYEANYNTAIDYYNQGVHRIKRINHKTEIYELLVIQEECITLFKSSLPYMLKAHEYDPERKETLIGLMAIYRALNDYELSDKYKNTLTDLVERGVIQDD